jgi:hypothetical protein
MPNPNYICCGNLSVLNLLLAWLSVPIIPHFLVLMPIVEANFAEESHTSVFLSVGNAIIDSSSDSNVRQSLALIPLQCLWSLLCGYQFSGAVIVPLFVGDESRILSGMNFGGIYRVILFPSFD